MKTCLNCVLTEKFPGIKFNEQGICNLCLDFKGEEKREENKLRYRKKFEDLLREYKGKENYDALMAYSGGKDSTFTLSLLKEEFGLNILAFTFDNGFLPEQTFKNLRNVTEKLNIDHFFFRPRFDILRKIFVVCSKKNIFPPVALVRASTICTSCMAFVKSCSLRIAVEKNIPFIIFGWSPGQIPITSSIMKNNPQMVKVMQQTVFGPISNIIGSDIKPYLLEEKHFQSRYFFPYNISPLAFLDYDEHKILKKAEQLDWKTPPEVDANSTNCLLNSFANVIHKKQHGFHPYAFELAKLVREGYLERSSAIEKINRPENPKTIELVKKKLKLKKN